MTAILLNKPQTAERIGVSVRTLEGMMHFGTGPRFVRLSPRMVRWKVADIDAWVKDQPTYASNAA